MTPDQGIVAYGNCLEVEFMSKAAKSQCSPLVTACPARQGGMEWPLGVFGGLHICRGVLLLVFGRGYTTRQL